MACWIFGLRSAPWAFELTKQTAHKAMIEIQFLCFMACPWSLAIRKGRLASTLQVQPSHIVQTGSLAIVATIDGYFKSGSRPGVQGAPAASKALSNSRRSVSL